MSALPANTVWLASGTVTMPSCIAHPRLQNFVHAVSYVSNANPHMERPSSELRFTLQICRAYNCQKGSTGGSIFQAFGISMALNSHHSGRSPLQFGTKNSRVLHENGDVTEARAELLEEPLFLERTAYSDHAKAPRSQHCWVQVVYLRQETVQ